MADYVVLTDRLAGPVDEETKRAKRYRRGDVVSDFTDEAVEKLLEIGAIAKKGSDEGKAAVESPASTHPAETGVATGHGVPRPHVDPATSDLVADANSRRPQAVARPAKTAGKDAWVDYAVRSGQKTQEAAEDSTRDELRDQLS